MPTFRRKNFKTSSSLQSKDISSKFNKFKTKKSLDTNGAVRSNMEFVLSEVASKHPVPQLLSALQDLPANWKPFKSSLIDTIRVLITVTHQPLSALAQGNSNMRSDSIYFYVRSPETGATARVISRMNGEELLLEFSVAKFLTGQNVIGIEAIHEGCMPCIIRILNLMQLNVPLPQRELIRSGEFRLMRVDFASHIDCGSVERADALMIALRNYLVGRAREVSFYEHKTLYIGQHSRRRSLKIYRKDLEIAKRPIPQWVYQSEKISKKTIGLVRLELTLRRDELERKGLNKPHSWNSQVMNEMMQHWVDFLMASNGHIPNIKLSEKLSRSLQQKLFGWLHGDSLSFSRGVTPKTYRENRNQVLKMTGINVQNHLAPEVQAYALATIRSVIQKGFGFHCFHKLWSFDKLVRPFAPSKTLAPN